MKLSINIACATKRFPLEDAIRLFKNAGFDAMDFSLCSMARADSPFCGRDYRAEAERVRAFADQVGLPINQTHAPFEFTPKQYDTEWDRIYDTTVRSLEISAILGAKIAVVHPIHHMIYHGHEEEIFQRNMAYYRSLIPYCREYGIQVGVENMWQRDERRRYIAADTCSRSEEFIRYIDTLDSEYMVACLDVGHVGLPTTDEEPEDVIRALGKDRLKALHIHDNDYKDDQHLLPYMGKLNWPEIARALGEIDYTGDFTYELTDVLLGTADNGFAPKAAAFMAEIGRHIMGLVQTHRAK